MRNVITIFVLAAMIYSNVTHLPFQTFGQSMFSIFLDLCIAIMVLILYADDIESYLNKNYK